MEESKIILKDLARLDYLDSIVIRKDVIIHNYIQLDSLRVDRIADYDIEVKELTSHKNKAIKRLNRTRKFSIIVGVVALIEGLILILK